ncbi:MAG: DNA starvation/stationary phase protection protein, partial [Chlorobi bacterium]|nr:DNA starvation/stationary phase protection protein [Chlorobiota bacterium]
ALKHTPLHTLEDYLREASLREAPQITDGDEALKQVRAEVSELLESQREILKAASEAEDEGTVSLMSEYIEADEKFLWMLDAAAGE